MWFYASVSLTFLDFIWKWKKMVFFSVRLCEMSLRIHSSGHMLSQMIEFCPFLKTRNGIRMCVCHIFYSSIYRQLGHSLILVFWVMQWIQDCSYSSDFISFGYTLRSGTPGSSVKSGRGPHLWVPEDRTAVLGQELRIIRTLWNTLLNSVKALLMISFDCKHLLTVFIFLL
jgi:hypothetical protein